MPDPQVYLIYDHDHNGKHPGAIRCAAAVLDEVLQPLMERAIVEKRTLIVTDREDFALLHVENGQMVFPTREVIDGEKQREPW